MPNSGKKKPSQKSDDQGSLILNQKPGEGWRITLYGCEVAVKVRKIYNGKVALLIRCPKHIEIERLTKNDRI